jgi:hypothetical protein
MKGDHLRPYVVFLIGSAILSSLLLDSCVFRQKYPPEWAELVSPEGNKCPDISGRYEIAGESIDKTPSYEPEKETWSAVEITESKIRPLYLYQVFPMKYFIFRGGVTGATYVQIWQPAENTLEISFMDDGGLIEKKIYSESKKEYACSPKGISFPFGRGASVGGVAGGMAGPIPFASGIGNWGKYYLARSTDGCLVIKEEGTAAAFFMMMPAVRPYETWHRFQPKSLP